MIYECAFYSLNYRIYFVKRLLNMYFLQRATEFGKYHPLIHVHSHKPQTNFSHCCTDAKLRLLHEEKRKTVSCFLLYSSMLIPCHGSYNCTCNIWPPNVLLLHFKTVYLLYLLASNSPPHTHTHTHTHSTAE